MGLLSWLGLLRKGQDPAHVDAGGRLWLSYRDGSGTLTQRVVRPVAKRADRDRFAAFCELRGDERSFVFERIETIADPTTGEVIRPDELFVRLLPGVDVPIALELPSARRIFDTLNMLMREHDLRITPLRRDQLYAAMAQAEGVAVDDPRLPILAKRFTVASLEAAAAQLTDFERPITRQAAQLIARGSGRKPSDADLLADIEVLFSGNGSK